MAVQAEMGLGGLTDSVAQPCQAGSRGDDSSGVGSDSPPGK